VTLVAQSMGAFSAPLACEHVRVDRMILVNPMIPRAGETGGEWCDAVGWRSEADAGDHKHHRLGDAVSWSHT